MSPALEIPRIFVCQVTAVSTATNTCSLDYDGDPQLEVPYYGGGAPTVGSFTLAFLFGEKLCVLSSGGGAAGPPGPTGPTGPTGPAGPTGPPGASFTGLSTDSGTNWAIATNTAVYTVSAMSWSRIGPLVSAMITITRTAADQLSTLSGDIGNINIASVTSGFPKPLVGAGANALTTGAGMKAQVSLLTTGIIYVAALTPDLSASGNPIWGTGAAYQFVFNFLTDINA